MATLNLGRIKPVFRGAYSGSTAYVVDDIVTSGNQSYICIQAHGAGTQAVTQTAYWSILAAKGTDGTDVSTTLTTQGDILYRDGSGLQRLAKPTSTMNLQMTSAGVASWAKVDLEAIKSDITALAIREATNENSAAFNLPSSFIETFTDDTNLGTETDGDRDSGSWQTIIPADGIDANTVFMMKFDNNLDVAGVNSGDITMTNSGSATFDSGTKKFGTHSLKLVKASSQFLTSTALNTGLTTAFPTTGDFTAECWIKYIHMDASNRWWCIGGNGTPSGGSTLVAAPCINAAGPSGVLNVHGDVGVGTWNIVEAATGHGGSFGAIQSTVYGNWRHYAYQRTGAGSGVWIDGVALGGSSGTTHLDGDNIMAGDFKLIIGARTGSTSEYMDCYMDEFRWSNISRYTIGTNFTPRTTAMTAEQANATGTLIQSANAVSGTRTTVGGTMLYKDNAGTNSIGTDLKIYFTADGGSNWTEAASYNAITPVYSSGIKMVRLGETTVTGGTDVRYKAVFANQASGSKEAQLHAIGINY